MARNPDRDLGEARECIDRGNDLAALKRLERARRGYVKQRDAEGLDHVLHMTDLVDASEERSRIGRENLRYAIKQNLRQESRRAARERGEAWTDPYPDLQAPTEHTGLVLTRGVKLVIGVGVLLGTVLLVAVFILPWFFEAESSTTVTLRLLNDTRTTVTVRGCDDLDCTTSWLRRTVTPGRETNTEVESDDLLDLFRIERPGDDACLPLRIHDGYQRLGSADEALAARLSQATPCPGTTVLPEPAAVVGL